MLKHQLLLIAVILFCGGSLLAQSGGEKPVIGILPFKVTLRNQTNAATQVESLTYDVFSESKRAALVEREFFHELENEKWRQSEDDFIDGTVISKTQSRGATHILIGKVTFLEIETNRKDDGSYSYECSMKVSIRITNIETSIVEASDIWEVGGFMTMRSANTKERAVAKAVKALKRDINNFIDEFLPLEGGIKQVKADGNLIIGLGEQNGIKKNNRLSVFQRSYIDGAPYLEEVGEVQVISVNGPSLSTVRIKKGRQQIIQLIQRQADLILKTK